MTDPRSTNASRDAGGTTPRAGAVPAAQPGKKKGVFEWIMLAIGLSYGDEGEDKWAKRRREMEQAKSEK